MTSLSNRPNAALVVIDVQKGVVAGATRRDDVVRNISTLVDKARAEDVPVIWVQHTSDDELPEGSEQWQYVDELQRQETEPLVHKRYGDSFEDTVLESELAARGVGRLVVTGAQTDALRPVDAARRVHPRLRHDPRRRRPHDRGPLRVGCAPARPGDLAHQPVLVLAGRTGPDGWGRGHQRCQLRHLAGGGASIGRWPNRLALEVATMV